MSRHWRDSAILHFTFSILHSSFRPKSLTFPFTLTLTLTFNLRSVARESATSSYHTLRLEKPAFGHKITSCKLMSCALVSKCCPFFPSNNFSSSFYDCPDLVNGFKILLFPFRQCIDPRRHHETLKSFW